MKCKYCTPNKEICGLKFDDYICTREKGHTEEHAACGEIREGNYGKHPIVIWFDFAKKGDGQ